MSLKQATPRTALLAAVAAAVLTLGGVDASSATACVKAELDVQGMGSALQRVSQELWAAGYAAACPEEGDAAVGYDPVEGGLAAFRFIGAAAINHEFAFVGTDEPPSAAEIENAVAATPKGAGEPIVFPVAQTAIAVLANPPGGCEIGGGITWADLNRLFAGTMAEWGELATANGSPACAAAIARVVQAEATGTTYQFKNYLSLLEEERGAAGPGDVRVGGECVEASWAQLRRVENVETGAPNTIWPENDCNEGTTPVIQVDGGVELAETVIEEEGSIGFVSLPDADAWGGGGTPVVPLQNGLREGEATFGLPEVPGEAANCDGRKYTVPEDARRGIGDGIEVDWSTTFGAMPAIGGIGYPLCMLMFDAVWRDYVEAGYGKAANETIRPVVGDYFLGYVLDEEGQEDVDADAYSPLPDSGGEGDPSNVLDAARFALERLE